MYSVNDVELPTRQSRTHLHYPLLRTFDSPESKPSCLHLDTNMGPSGSATSGYNLAVTKSKVSYTDSENKASTKVHSNPFRSCRRKVSYTSSENKASIKVRSNPFRSCSPGGSHTNSENKASTKVRSNPFGSCRPGGSHNCIQ